jgi:general secretion pathway protein A
MYLEFYGLKDFPFRLAPDPRYLFRTEGLLEVLANLQYGIETAKGLLVITGEVGTGKTTALRSHLESEGPDMLSAYIFNPLLSNDEFYDTLASEFRLKPQATKSAMLRSIGSLLLSRHLKKLRTVLIIDEAHLLPLPLLEEIRLLSNFETSKDKLLQIILCGQPELSHVLDLPEMRQFKQRVSLKCQVNAMTLGESADYIRWRLQVAGATDEGIFTPEAIWVVHRVSGGIPRIVNNICDNALLTGYSQEAKYITPDIIREVADILGFQEPAQGLSDLDGDTAPPAFIEAECDAPGDTTAESEDALLADILENHLPCPASNAPSVPGWNLDHETERRPENVHYLHKDFDEWKVALPARWDSVRFTIEIGTEEASAHDSSSSKFFSRVRVGKCS